MGWKMVIARRVGVLLLLIFVVGCIQQSEYENIEEKLNQTDMMIVSINEKIDRVNAEVNKESPDYSKIKPIITSIKSDVEEIKRILADIDTEAADERQKEIIHATQLDAEAMLLEASALEATIEGKLAIESWVAYAGTPDFTKIDFDAMKKEIKTARNAFTRAGTLEKEDLAKLNQINIEVLSPDAKSKLSERKAYLQTDIDAESSVTSLFEGFESFTEGLQFFVTGADALKQENFAKAIAELTTSETKFLEAKNAFEIVKNKGPSEIRPDAISLIIQSEALAAGVGHYKIAVSYLEKGDMEKAKEELDKAMKVFGL